MGFFDRENQNQSGTTTMERPKTETKAETGSGGGSPSTSPQRSTSTGSQQSPSSQAPSYSPGMTVGKTSKSSMTFRVRWTNQEGDVLTEYMQNMMPAGMTMGTCHIASPQGWPSGRYKLEVMLNDACAASMDFEVK